MQPPSRRLLAGELPLVELAWYALSMKTIHRRQWLWIVLLVPMLLIRAQRISNAQAVLGECCLCTGCAGNASQCALAAVSAPTTDGICTEFCAQALRCNAGTLIDTGVTQAQCSALPQCPHPSFSTAPSLSHAALALVAISLAAAGVLLQRRRQARQPS